MSDFSKLKLPALITYCKENHIKGYSNKKKADIINLIKNNKKNTKVSVVKSSANELFTLLNDKILPKDEKERNETIDKISTILNVAKGTTKRWIELKNVPNMYRFELMKITGCDIDYSKFTFKEKDQFFTPKETCKYCYNISIQIIKDIEGFDPVSNYIFIEPSAGSGNFLELFPTKSRIGLDIEPRNEEIQKQDYLTWKPEIANNKKYIVMGNPPFGLRGQLALKFINHSSTFADYVCFILPQLFESDGKGVPRKRVIGYNLIHSEKLNTEFTDPNNKSIKVECIFQIWSKHNKNDKYAIKEIDSTILKVYSLSDGGTPSSTRNKKMFHKCDIYIPSTCFGKENMKYYSTFKELPKQRGYGIVFLKNKKEFIQKFKLIDWSTVAFKSTNSAYNLRMSNIISQFE